MNYGSLFAGIGGFDLGLERAGMECAWQVEIDEYCTRVLEKHWPDVRRFRDVKELHGVLAHATGDGQHSTKVRGSTRETNDNREEGKNKGSGIEGRSSSWSGMEGQCPSCLPPVDLICGGFPCQPYSVAGKRRGAEDDRNLWPEFLRIVRELRPAWVVGENVPGIVPMYLDTVLADLEGEAYTCWTFNIPACAFDAPHRRERIFVVAHAESYLRGTSGDYRSKSSDGGDTLLAYASKSGLEIGQGKQRNNGAQQQTAIGASWWTVEPDVCGMVDGISPKLDEGGINDSQRMDTNSNKKETSEARMSVLWFVRTDWIVSQRRKSEEQFTRELAIALSELPHGLALGEREATLEATWQVRSLRQTCKKAGLLRDSQFPFQEAWLTLPSEEKNWAIMATYRGPWVNEWPRVPRVASGIENRVHRLRSLGNAVVPQVVEFIGRRIVETS